MKNLYLSLCLLFSVSYAVAESADDYYPIGCFYKAGEQYWPIAEVDGSRPIAKVDGERTTVSVEELRFDRVDLYGKGFIEIVSSDAYGREREARADRFNDGNTDTTNQGFADVAFYSDIDIENCYAVVFSGKESTASETNLGELFVTIKSLGNVQAGVMQKETLPVLFENTNSSKEVITLTDYRIAFFGNTGHIRSSSDHDIANFFLSRKKEEHRFYMDQYVANNPGKSLKQTPFFIYTPYLPEAIYSETGPIDVKAVFTINGDGTVQTDKLIGLDNAEAETFLTNRINEWLFFPAIKDGHTAKIRTATKIAF